MEEAMKKHTAQIEKMLKEVESWEGRKRVPMSTQAGVLKKHGMVLRMMLEEVELLKGTRNCVNDEERFHELAQ